jgi:hypothetical protein
MRFRKFLENSEEMDDVEELLDTIPKSHAALVKGYKWNFQSGNTLKGDNEHIGYIDNKDKEIVIAGPWNYSRSHAALHEIGHQVWDTIGEKLQKEWKKIVKNTKEKPNQDTTELFCHAYASSYAHRPSKDFYKPEWVKFIKKLPS